jgi:hypothetical protein
MSGTSERAGSDELNPAPGELIDQMRALGSRTRAAAQGYWLPLLLFGALICGSLPLYERLRSPLNPAARPGPSPCTAAAGHPCHRTAGPTGPAGQVIHLTVVTALGYYWQIAILAAVVLTVLWYRRRADRSGLRTPTRSFLITGLVLGEFVLLVPLLAGQSEPTTRLLQDTHHAGPLLIIAALLWVLAWSERSRALTVITAIYLTVAVTVSAFTYGGVIGGTTGSTLSLTAVRWLGLLPALALLTGGAAAARRHPP